MSVEWTETRQSQWSNNGLYVVEISAGGVDYTNPDALTNQYPGEFETFRGMLPAVEAAIKIAELWKADEKKRKKSRKIHIGWGGTGGMTMPFDAMGACKTNYKILRREAAKHDEKLEKCECCGEILPAKNHCNSRYGNKRTIMDNEYPFCSVHCAEKDECEWHKEELKLSLEALDRERMEELLTECEEDWDADDSDEELRTQIKWLVEDGRIELGELV